MVEPGGALRRGWGRVLSRFVAGAVAASVIATSGAALAAQAAAIVVDAKTGKVLYSSNPDARAYPASLTKMMTLYLLFEAIESGKTSLDSQDSDLGPCRRAGAFEARSEGRPDDHASATRSWRWSPSRPTTSPCAIGEYLGGSEERLRGPDDRQGPRDRHVEDDVPQRLGPAQSATDDHGARHGDSRSRAARSLPALLRLFLDRELRLRQAAHPQPQPSARPRRRRQRHQDRLHPRLGLQPRHLGRPRRPPARRRRPRRQDRQGARPEA